MKSYVIALLIFAGFVMPYLPVAAQDQPALKNISDASLPQLMKEKKSIHFVAVPGKQGTNIQWYEDTKQSSVPTVAVMPAVAGAATNNFHLTKDINTQTDANPVNSDFIFNTPYAVINKIMYFSASDGIHGAELWRSDGTAAGTYLVKDLAYGTASSNPTEIINAGNSIYFVTQNNALFSYQLWTSDGTESGTTMVQDLQRQGPGVNGTYSLTYTGNAVFFIKRDPFSGYIQLWKTTGTAAGTVLVKDFTGIGDSPLEYKAAQGLFYFTIYSPVSGRELWRSDGTDAGTFMVKDIYPGNDFFNSPEQLTEFNNKLYFSADDGNGRRLWLTDGTTAGTMPASGSNTVMIIDDGSYVFTNQSFAIQGNKLYMDAATPATGSELYKYNINTGFSLVKDITPGTAGGYIYTITPAFGKIVFQYNDTLNRKVQLWGTDGVAAVLIKSYEQGHTSFDQLTPGNQVLYFVARDSSTGYELWKTDGTDNGTVLIKDIYAGATSSRPSDLTYVNGSLYFNAASKKAGTELWQSMGDAASTKMITEINTTATNYSGPGFYSGTAYSGIGASNSSINNTLYFVATRPETGYELYKSEGTAGSTALAKDIIQGEIGSQPSMFSTLHGAVYFVADKIKADNTYFKSIYKADSTGKIIALATFPYGFVYSYDVADNGWVYYTLFNFASNAYELWRTDGTPAGNIMLTNKLSSFNYTFTVKTVGNTAYFTAADEDGAELWKTDGSIAGTQKVKDINTGSNSSNPYSFTVYNNSLYFGADDGSSIALWRSDPMTGSTLKVKNIQPYGLYSSGFDYTNYFCVVNDVLYMNAAATGTGTELWKTDGTTKGTVLVKDLNGDASNSDPSFLTNVNGSLFFSALYNQLWKSDGTKKGTLLVKTFPNFYYYLFSERCVADGKFFFNTDKLLWVSDGTDAGTHLVMDNGLNGVSQVTNLTAASNTVFFNGYSDQYSYELYAGDAARVHPSTLIAKQQFYKTPSSFSVKVLQNPLAGMLKMNVASGKDQMISIIVSNAIGNVTAQQKTILNKGSNNVQLNAANWQAGVYLVKLYNAAGEAVSVQVFK